MKIKVQKNDVQLFVEIPAHVNVKQLSLGEKFTVTVASVPVDACFIADKKSLLLGDGSVVRLTKQNHGQAQIVRPVEPKKSAINSRIFGPLKSPMTGKIVSVAVKNEDVVKLGDVLVIIEAMKMENCILSEGEGVVKNIQIVSGTNVTAGDMLLTLVALNAE